MKIALFLIAVFAVASAGTADVGVSHAVSATPPSGQIPLSKPESRTSTEPVSRRLFQRVRAGLSTGRDGPGRTGVLPADADEEWFAVPPSGGKGRRLKPGRQTVFSPFRAPRSGTIDYSEKTWGLPDGLAEKLPWPGDAVAATVPLAPVPYSAACFKAWFAKEGTPSSAPLRSLVGAALEDAQRWIDAGRPLTGLESLRDSPSVARLLDLSLEGLAAGDAEAVLRLRVNVYERCAEYGSEFEAFVQLIDRMCGWYSPETACREALNFATRFHKEGCYGHALRYYGLVANRFSNLPRRDWRIAKYRMDRIRQRLRGN